MVDDITPSMPNPPADEVITQPSTFGSGNMSSPVGGFMASPSSLTSNNLSLNGANEQILIGSATAVLTGIGIFLGNVGDGTYDFRAGDPAGHYIHWDQSTATLTIVGDLTASSIDIPDTTTANSFHVDSNGNAWWGATTLAGAVASVTKAGVGTFSNLTITGGSIGSSVDLSSGAIKKGAQSQSNSLVFSVASATQINWTSGTIKMQDGTTYSISSGNTGTMAALTYIYLDIGVSTTVLQHSTTYSDAVGDSKVLLGMAQNGATTASFIPYGAGQALINGDLIGALSVTAANVANTTITAAKIVANTLTAAQIAAGTLTATELASGAVTSAKSNLALRGWTQTSAFSVSSATVVAWGAGTFTASDGTAYSISSGNTGTMAAKTYVYLNIAVSTTAYQVSTTATDAVGDGKVLIAVCQNNTTEATYFLLNNNSYNIDASNIVTGSITANEIAAATITGAKIAAITIAAGNIVAGTITATQIAAATITASNIAANTITAAQIAAGTITTTEIAANTITAGDIAAGTITATQIAASTITAAKMNVSQLSAIVADLGTITAGSITINSGVASIDSSGNATFKSVTVGGGSTQYIMRNNGYASYGDGSDGSVTFDGTTTVLGIVPSGSSYSLTRDIYVTSLTVNSGVSLATNGYRIFCTGVLTNNGYVSCNGGNGSNGSSSSSITGANGGAGAGGLTNGFLVGSVAGAAGGRGSDIAGNTNAQSSTGTSVSNSLGSNGAQGNTVFGGNNGGRGGTGSNGDTTQLPGGTSTAGTATAANVKLVANWHLFTLLDISSTGSTIKFNNSAGSAGGGGGGAGSKASGGGTGPCGGGGGGGAGSGGGIIAIYARSIINSATGNIQAIGGNGGNGGNGATNTTNNAGGGGGGGGGSGGNGGLIILVYNSLSNLGSIVYYGGSGGTGGTGGGSGGGSGSAGTTGGNGNNGNSGVLFSFEISL